jgi:predicted transcriptional regulator
MEEMAITNNELTDFFKALADANRLKIIGLLAQQPLSVEQIAEMLSLHPSTISHHLGRLSRVGLVSASAEGYYSIYHLETKILEEMSRRLLAQQDLPEVAGGVDLDAYDRKVLKNYLTLDGRLKGFPTQQKKIEVILRYVVRPFSPGVRYTEKQVNEILSRYHEDTAWLRRYLVDFHFMERQRGGSEYWLAKAK